MSLSPHRPEALAWQVFRGSQAIGRHLLTTHQLRGRAWIRVRHDVYADARLDRNHGLACRATMLRLPAGVVLAGPSAAYLDGVEHAASFTDPVHVIVPAGLRVNTQQGLVAHSTGLDSLDIRTVDGLHRTTPGRTAGDLACWLGTVPAVSIIDGMLGNGLVTVEDLAAEAARRAARPAGRRLHSIFALTDGGARSPARSRLRVRLVLAGLPRPMTRHPVRLTGGLVLRPDLAWPLYQVAVAYDDQCYADPDASRRDRQRLDQLIGAGWIVLSVTSGRMRRDLGGLLREVRGALTARGWRPAIY